MTNDYNISSKRALQLEKKIEVNLPLSTKKDDQFWNALRVVPCGRLVYELPKMSLLTFVRCLTSIRACQLTDPSKVKIWSPRTFSTMYHIFIKLILLKRSQKQLKKKNLQRRKVINWCWCYFLSKVFKEQYYSSLFCLPWILHFCEASSRVNPPHLFRFVDE